jgi:drug/metabolite transporter (DMT)-like permease
MNHATSLWFGAFRAPTGERRPLSPRIWTCVGALAIPLWSTWPALALWSFEVPAFECLAIAFAVGWLILALLERPTHVRWRASAAAEPASGSLLSHLSTRLPSWLSPIACAIGLSGSNAFHILATHYIPAAEANLISYLWPVEIVAAGAVLGLFKLRARQIAGLGLGFAGVVVLMAGGKLSMSGTGAALALLSGLSWAAYCIFRLKWPRGPMPRESLARDASAREPTAHELPVKGRSRRASAESEGSSGNSLANDASSNVLATGCAISTALCVGLHFALEPTVMPSLSALGAAAAVGVVPLALGNYVWDEGFRRGDSQLLAVLAYATPLCSALLLGALGLASLTWGLLLGGAIIVTAGVLSRADSSGAR